MHAVGRLFPRGDRAPAIEPVRPQTIQRLITAGIAGWDHAANASRLPRLLHFSGAGGRSPVTAIGTKIARTWTHVGTRFLPFADAATPELPLGRLLRLSLFQVSVGLAVVLLIGTLNRVMIVELGVPAWLVAVMISLPLVFAPFRGAGGFPFGYAQISPGLAPCSLHLDGHADSVWWSGDNAVRTDRAVRRLQRPADLRPHRCWPCVPAGRRGVAHHANGWSGAGDRPRPNRIASAGRCTCCA